jgi:fatty acid desaturase
MISRAVSIALSVGAMGLGAHALGRLTGTQWVWWLAPVTVAFEGSRLLRSQRDDCEGPISSEVGLAEDPVTAIYVASAFVAAGCAAWGAISGNRPAIILGAILAILGRALERDEDPAVEDTESRQPVLTRPNGSR